MSLFVINEHPLLKFSLLLLKLLLLGFAVKLVSVFTMIIFVIIIVLITPLVIILGVTRQGLSLDKDRREIKLWNLYPTSIYEFWFTPVIRINNQVLDA